MTNFLHLRQEFLDKRQRLIADNGQYILNLETNYMDALVKTIVKIAPEIDREFTAAPDYLPFWLNYAPRQRGRAPVGDAVPWGEVGEKLILSIIAEGVAQEYPGARYPALPFGGDFRFATTEALVHLDVKMTGPRDSMDEIVASPNQISGDGCDWDVKGVMNNEVQAVGERKTQQFQPELPPFYFSSLSGIDLQVCLTYFLKAVYSVASYGHQPLEYMEVICVPNGLLMFDGPKYINTRGLLIPGKDEQGHTHPRTRVRLNPLTTLGTWRCVKIKRDIHNAGTWVAEQRPAPHSALFF